MSTIYIPDYMYFVLSVCPVAAVQCGLSERLNVAEYTETAVKRILFHDRKGLENKHLAYNSSPFFAGKLSSAYPTLP